MIEKLQAGAATPRTPLISMLSSALIQPLVVQVGTVPRFYFNALQGDADGMGELSWQLPIGAILFTLSCVGFGFTTYSTIDHIGPLDSTLYPDDDDRTMAEVLVWLSLTQLGYPIVAVVEYAWLWIQNSRGKLKYNEYSARLSAFKDVLYATLDISTKAGLALVAFLVATR